MYSASTLGKASINALRGDRYFLGLLARLRNGQ
jgi:hypothetical protein